MVSTRSDTHYMTSHTKGGTGRLYRQSCELTMGHCGVTDQMFERRPTKTAPSQSVSVSAPRCSLETKLEWLNLVFFKSNPLSLPGIRCYSAQIHVPSPLSASPLFHSCWPSLGSLRCASSCAAPSDPTARNTCRQTGRETKNSLLSCYRWKRKKFVLSMELNVAVS